MLGLKSTFLIVLVLGLAGCDSADQNRIDTNNIPNTLIPQNWITDVGSPEQKKSKFAASIDISGAVAATSLSSPNALMQASNENLYYIMDLKDFGVSCYVPDPDFQGFEPGDEVFFEAEWAKYDFDDNFIREGVVTEPDVEEAFEALFDDSLLPYIGVGFFTEFQCFAYHVDSDGVIKNKSSSKRVRVRLNNNKADDSGLSPTLDYQEFN